MAATNYTPIQLYFSTTASAVPLAANLAQGELAINITDGKLYYEDNGGVVQVIATKGAGTIGGSTTQIQYNNAGALAGNAAMTFNSGTSTTTLTTLNLTNALGAIYGGTAQSTYTQGDFLYASASNTLSKLGIGTVNYILTSTGSIPQWSAPSSIIVQTATNLAGGLAGSVPYQSALDTTTFLAIGAANRVMTSTGSAPQWVTALSGLTSVSSSSINNTSLTSGRVVYSGAVGIQADSANLTFDGTTLSAAGLSTTGFTTMVKTITAGNSSFNGIAVFAPTTPAKLFIGTGTVTDVTSSVSATNAAGAIMAMGITPIAATNASVTYTNASTLYIAGAPSASTNITITNPYALYVAAGASYFGGAVTFAGSASLAALTVTSLTDSGLTSGRVTYAGASGLLSDSSTLTYDGTSLTTPRLVLGGTTLPSAGTATLFSRTSDNNTYLQTGSGNNINFLDGSQNTLVSFSPASLSFNISNTNKLTLNSTTLYTASGVNVGIGTSSPTTTLSIVSANASSPALGVPAGKFSMLDPTSAFGFYAGVSDSGNTFMQAMRSASAVAYDILLQPSGGNLGLGTTPSPFPAGRTVLEIGGSTTGNIAFNGNATNGYQIWCNSYFNAGSNFYYANGLATNCGSGAGSFFWNIAPNNTSGTGAVATFTRAMTLSDSGNLSLNITPSAFGSTYKAFQAGGYAAYVGDGNNGYAEILNNAYASNNNIFNYYDTNSAGRYSIQLGAHKWFSVGSGSANAVITWTQAMTLNASGNLLLGNTTAVSGAKLEVTGALSATATGAFFTNNGATTSSKYIQILNTSGGAYLGVESSAGGSIITGSTAYDASIVGQSGISFSGNNGSALQMRLSSAGNVVIGDTTGGGKLSVRDASAALMEVKTTTGTNYAALEVVNTGGSMYIGRDNSTGTFFGSNTAYSSCLYSSGAYPMVFMTNGGNERMRIDAAGNVGIAITPSAWQTTLGSRAIQFTGSSIYGYRDTNILLVQNAYLDSTATWKYTASSLATAYSDIGSGAFGWFQAASGTAGGTVTFTRVMTLNADGTLGIGSTGAGNKLTVSNAGANGFEVDPLSASGTKTKLLSLNRTSSAYTPFQYDASLHEFQTSGTEKARISSNGFAHFLGSATSYFNSTGAWHSVESTTADDTFLVFNNNANPYGVQCYFWGAAPNNGVNYFYSALDTSATRFRVYSNGGIANYQANDSNLSDSREKKNIELAPNYLDKICQIPVKTFLYNDQTDTDLNLGVIAQDVEAVCPELIVESNWASKDKEPKMRKSIYQTDLQYALMKCIQEQQALIESLTTRLTALENK